MALSFALHGLAVLPLFLIAGTLGSTSQEPALLVEFSIAAPTVGANAEPAGAPAEAMPQLPQPPAPAVETSALPPELSASAETAPEPEAASEIVVVLPQPEEPPKPKLAPAKPAPRRPAAKPVNSAQAPISPATGDAAVTHQATADVIVWEGKPRYRVPPRPAVYPPRAIDLGQQGEVVVRVRLEPDGSAAEIRLWRSSGFNLLDRAALAAVHGWHFHPAMRGGRPVAAWVEIPVRFHLH